MKGVAVSACAGRTYVTSLTCASVAEFTIGSQELHEAVRAPALPRTRREQQRHPGEDSSAAATMAERMIREVHWRNISSGARASSGAPLRGARARRANPYSR